MKYLFLSFLLAGSLSHADSNLGGILQDSLSDVELSLKCIAQDENDQCIKAKVYLSICEDFKEDSRQQRTYNFRLFCKKLNASEITLSVSNDTKAFLLKRAVAIHTEKLNERYLTTAAIGTIIGCFVMYGPTETETAFQYALCGLGGIVGAAIDVAKSPLVGLAYLYERNLNDAKYPLKIGHLFNEKTRQQSLAASFDEIAVIVQALKEAQ